MKKLFVVMIVMIAAVTLVGCGARNNDTSGESVDAAPTPTSGEFGIESCDKYVSLMQCVVDNSPEASRDAAQQGLDQTISAWKQVDESQLEAACDQIVATLDSVKESYAALGCEI